ncbi:hypothetical protein DXG01_010705 [Tephrocybe rancida]|nr:hypothetical protein DXG01_010705 [Tephrocybe rancida]
MSDTTSFPSELILEIVDRLEDTPTLAALSLAASYLRSPCQKKVFSSVTLHLISNFLRDEEPDNFDELERILAINPALALHVKTLTVRTGNMDYGQVPSSLGSMFPHLEHLKVLATSYLTNEIMPAIAHIMSRPSISSITFLRHEQNNWPSTILSACEGVTTLKIDMQNSFRIGHRGCSSCDEGYRMSKNITPVIVRSKRGPNAYTRDLTIPSASPKRLIAYSSLFSQVLDAIDGDKLNSLTTELSSSPRSAAQSQDFVNAVATSLRKLFLWVPTELENQPLSLVRLSELTELSFGLRSPVPYIADDLIFQILDSVFAKDQLQTIVVCFEGCGEAEEMYGSFWGRLNCLLDDSFDSTTLHIRGLEGDNSEEAINKCLTSIVAQGRVVFDTRP